MNVPRNPTAGLPPGLAPAVLRWLYRIESSIALASFILITVAIFADLASREFFGQGIFGAQRFAVYCMVIAAFLGFALAVGWRAHLGIEVADALTPKRWNARMEQLSDLVAAGACLFLAYWSWRFVSTSIAYELRGQAIEILVWPMQSVLVWCFASSAVRHLIFARHPALRPAGRG